MDALQSVAHGLARLFVDDFGASHVLAILRVVGDGVVHVGNAAFVHQVHNQFQLVQALEVGHLGRVASFGQGFEAHLHQLHGTAAQHGLLAEQVSFGFFLEVGLDDATLAAAVGRSVGQSDVTRLAGAVLVHSDQRRYAAALQVFGAHGVARALGSNHDHVQVSAGHHLVVVHVEAVSESQHSALLDVGLNVVLVHLGDVFVGQQDHDHVCSLHRFIHFHHGQASLAHLVPGSTALAQTDNDFHAAVVQVLCVGVALAAVADDGHSLALDQAQITVFVVENFHSWLQLLIGVVGL